MRAIRAAARSSSLRATFFLTLGGAGFAVANVLLARVLPADAYGQVSLGLALIGLGLNLGTLGLEVTINRRGISASRVLLAWVLVSSTIIGTGMAGGAAYLYRIPAGFALCLAVAAAASSFNRVGSAFLQSQKRFGYSLALAQVHNYVLLCTVPVVLLLESASATHVIAVVALGYVITAVTGWSLAWPHAVPRPHPRLGSLLRDSLAGLGIGLAVQFLWQLERLVIPQTLSMTDLGTFAVVAATAGSPFRMIQIGIGHTLVPSLRSCRNRREVEHLLRREGRVVGAAVAASAVIAPVMTLLIAEYFLKGRYDISMALIAAVVVTGLIKVWQGFASAVVQAFATTGMMLRLTILSWIGAVAGVGCAIQGARYGLVGIVAGVGVAWFIVGVVASGLAVTSARTWSVALGTANPEHD